MSDGTESDNRRSIGSKSACPRRNIEAAKDGSASEYDAAKVEKLREGEGVTEGMSFSLSKEKDEPRICWSIRCLQNCNESSADFAIKGICDTVSSEEFAVLVLDKMVH
jgi:hypothetical protein